MALSDDLKCLCLGESLNIYATSRIILENELHEKRWIRPVDLIKPFGPIEGKYDDIRLDVFTYFPAANFLLQLGMTLTAKVAKVFPLK